MHIDKRLAKELWQYRNKWVALSKSGKVLADSKDLKDAHAKVTKNGATDRENHKESEQDRT